MTSELVYIATTTPKFYEEHRQAWNGFLDDLRATVFGSWSMSGAGEPSVAEVESPDPYMLRWRVVWPVPESDMRDELQRQQMTQGMFFLVERAYERMDAVVGYGPPGPHVALFSPEKMEIVTRIMDHATWGKRP